MKKRKEELLKTLAGCEDGIRQIVAPLVDEVVYLEAKLEELRALPSIAVNPKNPAQQRTTSAGKQYKEYLQQYNNCIKILCSALSRSDVEEDSPLRQYVKSLKERYQ